MGSPFVGLTLIISFAIITVGSLFRLVITRFYKKHEKCIAIKRPAWPCTSVFITFCILLLSLSTFGLILQMATSDYRSNFYLAVERFSTCHPLPPRAVENNLIVLRLDDVQAYTWTDTSIAMMQEALKREMPMVAGVIAKDINNAPTLRIFFKQQQCNVEVALHGYTHSKTDDVFRPETNIKTDAEFGNLDTIEATDRLQKAMAELEDFPSGKVVTFIPPENVISPDATSVLDDFGIRYLSSEGKERYDYRASSWDFLSESYVPASEIIERCNSNFATGNRLCVIMLHPQDFVDEDGQLDPTRFADYLHLLDEIEEMPVSVVTFRDLDRDPELRAITR